MNVVGRVSSFISQGVYSVATPFHPFGGAVDIIVVQQRDGTFRSTPWYVRFGKFQGVLKGAEKIVRLKVNGNDADFHMYLDNSGEAYFIREIDLDKDDSESIKDSENLEYGGEENSTFFSNTDNSKENEIFVEQDNYFSDVGVVGRNERASLSTNRIELVGSDTQQNFAEFQDEHSSLESSGEFPEFYSSRYDNLESIEDMLELQDSNSDVILVSVDGHILTAPVVSSEGNPEEVQLNTPRFHLGPATKETGEYDRVEEVEAADYLRELDASTSCANKETPCSERHHVHLAQETQNLVNVEKGVGVDSRSESWSIDFNRDNISRSYLMQGFAEQSTDDNANKGSLMEARIIDDVLDEDCSSSPVTNKDNNVRNLDIPRNAVASATNSDSSKSPEILLSDKLHQTGIETSTEENSLAANSSLSEEKPEAKRDDSEVASTPSRAWRLWPIPFRRVKTIKYNGSISSSGELLIDLDTASQDPNAVKTTNATVIQDLGKQIVRTNVPTTGQIASLNLKDGQNMVTFIFSTTLLGSQKVEAHIYLWKWNTRIVISDVDGTITKSDVLGQVMPLVGRDWTHSGIARLFSAIKENGYQLLFLSARAIVQSYLTKNFLFNLKQDGKSLPSGPVFISPDGLFPSLYREVIRRAPHEFKIACLEDIKALFPPDYNPFYAGFGNRDTDELSYLKIGIPKGKIFIINPKGEVAINHRVDVKSYLSLHTLVNDMFPPTSLLEQEDFNSWNYWKLPLPNLDDL